MGILDLWFQVGYETITSTYVVIELEDGEHANALASIHAGQVREAVISAEEMAGDFEDLRLSLESSGLSAADISVLYLAIREDAMLLSGDRQLRKQAHQRLVEVHGTLWILDRLVEEALLPHEVAADCLEALLTRTGRERRYLPADECDKRIRSWRRT